MTMQPHLRLSFRKSLPYAHGAFEFVCVLQHFQPKVRINIRFGKPLFHDGLCGRTDLAAEKCAEPRAQKKDLPVTFDLRKLIECTGKKRLRQIRLVPGIERSKALCQPVFRLRLHARRYQRVLREVAVLRDGVGHCRLHRPSIFLPISRLITLALCCEERPNLRIV